MLGSVATEMLNMTALLCEGGLKVVLSEAPSRTNQCDAEKGLGTLKNLFPNLQMLGE